MYHEEVGRPIIYMLPFISLVVEAQTSIQPTPLCAEPAAYYAHIDASLGGALLQQQLHTLIRDHITVPYTSSSQPDTWDALMDLDADAAGDIRQIYSSARASRK